MLYCDRLDASKCVHVNKKIHEKSLLFVTGGILEEELKF